MNELYTSIWFIIKYMKYEFAIHLIDSKDKLARTTFIPEFSKLNSKLFVTPFVFSFEGENVMLSLDKNGWWNPQGGQDRKSTRLNSSHQIISYAVFCLKKKKTVKTTRIVM